MRRLPLSERSRIATINCRLVLAIVLTAMVALGLRFPAVSAQESDTGFAPINGRALVIAQGVVPLPEGNAVWRTIRTHAPPPDQAPFEPRPLGFVLATSGPILLVDADTGRQQRLGTGEAALVPAGTVQQRSSLGANPEPYLAIELVPADAPPPPPDATVLQPGQPFAAPPGLHDLDLISGVLFGEETYTLAETGAKNVILITSGAANVGRPGGEPVVLLAGEAASFSGEIAIGVAPTGAAPSPDDSVGFVIAAIGPEVPPPTLPANGTTGPAVAVETPDTPQSATGLGSITMQVFSCPPGMDITTLAAAACEPSSGDFDVTLSGEALATPLTLIDATTDGISFTWSELPFGDYVIAEAVLPAGATTYALAAANASGSPETGFRIRLDPENPELAVRIYNFSPR